MWDTHSFNLSPIHELSHHLCTHTIIENIHTHSFTQPCIHILAHTWIRAHTHFLFLLTHMNSLTRTHWFCHTFAIFAHSQMQYHSHTHLHSQLIFTYSNCHTHSHSFTHSLTNHPTRLLTHIQLLKPYYSFTYSQKILLHKLSFTHFLNIQPLRH